MTIRSPKLEKNVQRETDRAGDISAPQSSTTSATASPKPAALGGGNRSEQWRRLGRQGANSSAAYMLGVLVALCLVFSVLAPDSFPTTGNIRNLVVDTSIFAVMAVGMTYVMVAAGFDLSIGSVLVFAGICAAKTMEWVGGQGYFAVLAGLAAALLGGTAWGAFNALCVTKLRVPALITTLGTLGAALGVANLMTNGNDIPVTQKSMIHLAVVDYLGLPLIVWAAVAVLLAGGTVLRHTRFGRHTYLIGSNEEGARRSGIRVDAHLIKLYALSGLFAGLAGMMSLLRFSTTTVGGHSQDALTVITGVILGGTSLYGGAGSVLGTLIGILVPTVLQNGLVVLDVQPFWQNVAVGFILIAAVYLDQVKRRARDRR
ncbi:ABC transporter permease [Streptomyces longwoodensis]|uniref:ABC transporter permease n=1 Tax=Streptomyces longwoodensis TaxID=68231 RepID=UPI0033F256F4